MIKQSNNIQINNKYRNQNATTFNAIGTIIIHTAYHFTQISTTFQLLVMKFTVHLIIEYNWLQKLRTINPDKTSHW